jgi:hypothetical protein
MGRCHEFGTQIRNGCDHPMRPGDKSCFCPECGVVCGGQFDGCADVWARGLRPVTIAAPGSVSVGNGGEWTPQAVLTPPPIGEAARAKEVLARITESARRGVAAQHGPPDPPRPPQAPPEARPEEIDEPEPLVRPVRPIAAAAPRPSSAPSSTPLVEPVERAERPAPAPDQDDEGRSTPVKLAGPPGPRVQLFQWFEAEFGRLRGELQALVGTVAQQQAMVAELLEGRHVNQRLSIVAESLPEVVDEAVKAAVTEQVASVVDGTKTAMGKMDSALERTDSWIEEQRQDAELLDSSLGELRASLATLEGLIEEQRADLATESVRIRGIKSSLTRQIKPVVESIPQLVADAVAASLKEHRREVDAMIEAAVGDLGRSVKISISRQLEPIAEALEDIARSRNGRSRSPRQSTTQD